MVVFIGMGFAVDLYRVKDLFNLWEVKSNLYGRLTGSYIWYGVCIYSCKQGEPRLKRFARLWETLLC